MKLKLRTVALRAGVAACFVGVVAFVLLRDRAKERAPIELGVLVAVTGENAAFDKTTLNAVLAAIDVVNANGGARGHPFVGVVADTGSNAATAAREAERLARAGIRVFIGGNAPQERRAIESVIEPLDGLLLVTTSTEGLSDNPNIITLGLLPNQRAVPAAAWAVRNLGRRVFLLSSDSLLARTAHAILEDHVPAIGGEIVGDELVVHNGTNFTDLVDEIRTASPDVIVSGLDAASTQRLVAALRSEGITSDVAPIVSWVVRGRELRQLDTKAMKGDFLVLSALGVDDAADPALTDAFLRRSGGVSPDAQALVGAVAVNLVAGAIERGTGATATQIRSALLRATERQGGDVVAIDAESQATWKSVRIGRIEAEGALVEVWASNGLIRPRPWPMWRERAVWRKFARDAGAPSSDAAAPATEKPVPSGGPAT